MKFLSRGIKIFPLSKMKEILFFGLFLLVWLIWRNRYHPVVHKKNANDYQRLQELKQKLIPVHPIIAQVNVYPHSSNTYALEKTEVYLCVHDDSQSPYFENFLVYVYLHEIAHVLTPGHIKGPPDDEDHPAEFGQIYNTLLKRAEQLRLYNPALPFPERYCNKHINDWKK